MKALFFLASILLLPVALVQAVGIHNDWENEGVIISKKKYFNPEVIEVEDGVYRMFYEYNGSLYSSTSSNGTTWTEDEVVRLSNAVMPTIVQLADGTWRLYFVRVVDGISVVLSATSTNGEDFSEEEGIRLSPGHPKNFDQYGIKHPSVITLSDGTYRLYYDTMATEETVPDSHTWRILSAVSDDGLTFEHESGVRINPGNKKLKADAVWSPSVHYDEANNRYRLFFSAEYNKKPLTRNGIYEAISSSGKKFTVQVDPIVYRARSVGKKKMTKYGLNGAPQDPFFFDFGKQERLYYWIVKQGILSAGFTTAADENEDDDEDDNDDTNDDTDDSEEEETPAMAITSSAFAEGETIPSQYTCEGDDVNPPLTLTNVSSTAQSIAIIMDDPDAPDGTWVHWVIWNINPTTTAITADSVPVGAIQGSNDFGDNQYDGPCPPEGDGDHHYYFRMYALDVTLDIAAESDRDSLDSAMAGHILSEDALIGLYGIE